MQEEVKAALDKVCADTGGLAGTCKDLVDQYFPQIWQALVNKLVSVILFYYWGSNYTEIKCPPEKSQHPDCCRLLMSGFCVPLHKNHLHEAGVV